MEIFVKDPWFWDIFHQLEGVYNNGQFGKPYSESIQ